MSDNCQTSNDSDDSDCCKCGSLNGCCNSCAICVCGDGSGGCGGCNKDHHCLTGMCEKSSGKEFPCDLYVSSNYCVCCYLEK